MKTETLTKALVIQEKLKALYHQRDIFDKERPKPEPEDEDKITWPEYKVTFHNYNGYLFSSLDEKFSEHVVQLYYAVLLEKIAVLEREFAEL